MQKSEKNAKMWKIEKKTQCASSKTPLNYSTGVKSLLDGRVKTELCNYVQGGVCTFFSKFWKTKIKIHFIKVKNVKKCEKMWKNVKNREKNTVLEQ